MNTKQRTKRYAIIWFEGESTYRLVDKHSRTITLSYDEAAQDAAGIIDTEDALERAEDDLRYAISTELLEDLYGWSGDDE